MPENALRRQNTQHPGLQQSLSQKRIKKSNSPKNKDGGNKFKSSSRSKSFKKNAMFSSVTSANVNQNQITDQANFEFSTHRRTREGIDKAYKSLTKDEDSDLGGRTNSISRGSSLSNNGDISHMKESNHLFEN